MTIFGHTLPRWHMPHHIGRKLLAALAIVAVLYVLAFAGLILFLQSNYLRDKLNTAGSSKLGRELAISGPLDIEWHWGKTQIHAEKVTISNIEGSKEPNLMSIASADFSVKLSKLLLGRLELPSVSLNQPRLVLERAADGSTNWDFPALSSGNAAAKTFLPKARHDFPIIGEFKITDGEVIYRDAVKKLDMDLKLSTFTGDSDKKDGMTIEGTGTISGKPFKVTASGASLTVLRDTSKDYPVKADIVMGDTHAVVDGTFDDPLKMRGVDTQLSITGPNLADLYYLTSIPFPPTPAYKLSGTLKKDGDVWRFDVPKGRVGNSDVKADGSYDTGRERGFLSMNVASQKMYLDDLGGFIGLKPKGNETVATSSTKLFPDVPLNLERLRRTDLDVHLVAKSLVAPGWPFQSLDAKFNLDHGLLKIDPINAGIADGTMSGSLILDGRKDMPHVESDIMLRRLSVQKFFSGTRFSTLSSGHFGGRFVLAGDGKSLAQVLGDANGRVSVMMAGGQISLLIIEASGLDVAEGVERLFDDKTTRVRCGIGDFAVNNGMLTSDIFDFDTADTNLYGSAKINLQNETIDAQMEAHPKDASPLAARTPITISGPLKHPRVGIKPGQLALRGGAAAALALLNPLAAIIPFVETGGGEDTDCRGLIQQVRARYNGDIPGPTASDAPPMMKKSK
jgi:uncharacterized protein involved in outer membrane biogenesis